MTYPFVQSYTDLGSRRGPILGITHHMAEGGGTVGYLSRENPNGVSVQYVIEYSGRTVQMLLDSHMHTSIRIKNRDGSSAIRQTNGVDGFGGDVARAVLGDWYDVKRTLGPNHASVAIEVEGFAGPLTAAQRTNHPRANPLGGPNDAQVASLVRLDADLRAQHSTLRGNTGHRDHNVKACPGPRIPWASIGGHGLYAQEEPDMPAKGYTFKSSALRGYLRNVKQGATYIDPRDDSVSPLQPVADPGYRVVAYVLYPSDDPNAPAAFLVDAGNPLVVIDNGFQDWVPDAVGSNDELATRRFEWDRVTTGAAIRQDLSFPPRP